MKEGGSGREGEKEGEKERGRESVGEGEGERGREREREGEKRMKGERELLRWEGGWRLYGMEIAQNGG